MVCGAEYRFVIESDRMEFADVRLDMLIPYCATTEATFRAWMDSPS
jgi:hypothetical protein